MDYIENIYICLAAPLIIAIICLRRTSSRRLRLFLLTGMTVCLLSSYISSFLSAVYHADSTAAIAEIAPVVEEVMKLLPVLFYMVVLEPEKEDAAAGMLMTAVGFATFENVCYLTANGAERVVMLLARGFGTGAMHVVCGMLIAMGFMYLWDRLYLRLAGMVGLLAVAISCHAIYNMMVLQGGSVARAGFAIPLAVMLIVLIPGRRIIRKMLG